MNTSSSFEEYFSKSHGYREAVSRRLFKTNDIVGRVGVISCNRVFVNNYPITNPVAVFNPSMIVREDYVYLYARIVVGYYMYVSSIVEIPVPIDDIWSGTVNINTYASKIVVYPSTRYDIWGAEDPRTYLVDDRVFMTYCGRTAKYFDPRVFTERTVLLTAISRGDGSWSKVHVYRVRDALRDKVVSDKDGFLVKAGDNIYLFHRLHMVDGSYRLVISSIEREELYGVKALKEGLREVKLYSFIEAISKAGFEEKIGWATPPIRIKPNQLIALAYGVDRNIHAYRLFALELELGKEEVVVRAVTPSYIMEPRMTYELFGDRPYTILPCGLWRIGDKILLSYGAGDYMVGLATIDYDQLLTELDKGRIY